MLQGRFFRRLSELRDVQAQAPELPFTEALSADSILEVLAELKVEFRERLFTPITTLWVFLWQVLNADQSCRQALAHLLAHRVARGQSPCSTATGSYCKGRQRLPEKLFSRLLKKTGSDLQSQIPPAWLFHGRKVQLVDGTTASMPDTAGNAKAFDKPRNQWGASAFPMARLVVIMCWATGAVLDLAIGPCRGKKTGELSLFRRLITSLKSGDIVLGDRLFCTYVDIALLLARQVDVVFRMSAARNTDFRRGVKLGPNDHRLIWRKPTHQPEGMSKSKFAKIPLEIEMREVRLTVRIPGFRIRTLVVATTLLDDKAFSADELTRLYRDRWQAELNLRSIKSVMRMDVLRCQTAEMVRKEIYAHLLAYNLIRSLMCSAASESERAVVTISFKASLQLLLTFRDLLCNATADKFTSLCDALLRAIQQHEVNDRPNRVEPRKCKRPPKPYPRLKKPRDVERNLCHGKGCA